MDDLNIKYIFVGAFYYVFKYEMKARDYQKKRKMVFTLCTRFRSSPPVPVQNLCVKNHLYLNQTLPDIQSDFRKHGRRE